MLVNTPFLKLLAAAGMCLFLGLGIYLAPLQPSVVALQLTYTPEAFGRVVQAWGPEGVQRFRNHLPVDGVLLLCYGAAGYLAVVSTHFFEPLAKRKPLLWVAMLLPLAALCDAGENLLQWWLTTADVLSTPAAPVWYVAAGVCATLKWLGITGFAVAALVARARS